MNGNTERTGIAMRAGFVGVACNLLLFIFKLGLGFFTRSVAVMADAFNNLSDAASSLIALIGARISGKAADEQHPFGHGRMEYIAAFIVAFLVLEMGLKMLESSVRKLLQPEALRFHMLSVLILGVSVLVKLWMGIYYRRVGRRIDSELFRASSLDAFQDALITGASLFCMLLFHFSNINADAPVGILISFLVLKNGVQIAGDTLRPLLGQAADPELYRAILRMAEEGEGIYGAHDLILHNYGPGRFMGSIHAEVDGRKSIIELHKSIDRIEERVRRELGVMLVIHMDPLDDRDETIFYRTLTEKLLAELLPAAGFHDFRLRHTKEGGILLTFDLLFPWGLTAAEEESMLRMLSERLSKENPRISCEITPDHPFAEGEGERECTRSEHG